MTRILSTPERFASEALAGFASAYPEHVRAVPGGVVRAHGPVGGKVALVIGGGSGHYPAFPGLIGLGLADAAVAGEVFASPSTRQIVDVARQVDGGAGIVFGFGNYSGDVLNFSAAAQRLRDDGVDARTLVVTDDVASAPATDASARRGIAGGLVVFKVAGAAADAGAGLAAVMEIAEHCNARTRTLGIAFAGCTLPGADAPLFTVPQGRMGVGLGIHGEAGIDEIDIVDADALAAILLDPLLAEAPDGAEPYVAAVLNGLGGTKYEELFGLWHHIDRRLDAAGLRVVAPAVGEYYTSLDMAGCSLTLTWLDGELTPLWTASANTPAFHRGASVESNYTASHPVAVAAATPTVGPSPSRAKPASPESRASAEALTTVLDALHARLRDRETELRELDTWAGDGDHGSGMVRGSAAALEAATDAVARGAGVASTLEAAADAWADRAGGTSGALWGVLLRAWAGAYSDDHAVNGRMTAAGVRAALAAVADAGGAHPGDKTMVDALAPFAEELGTALDAGAPLSAAWCRAAERSAAAAAATAGLRPRRGRARPLAERSLGHPDPGAVSLADCAGAVGSALASFACR